MKNKIVIGLALISSVLIVGCSTTPPTATQTALISALAMDGTYAILSKSPNDAPQFDEAVAALTLLGSSTNLLSYQTVETVLAVTGQTNTVIQLAVANVRPIADAYIGTNSPNIAVQSATVKQVCLLVAGGITQGETIAGVK